MTALMICLVRMKYRVHDNMIPTTWIQARGTAELEREMANQQKDTVIQQNQNRKYNAKNNEKNRFRKENH